MPPLVWWLSGRDDVSAAFGASDDCVNDRLLPIRINATIGFAQPTGQGAAEAPLYFHRVRVKE